MSGFYSKDLILESFYSINISALMGLFFLVGVGLTTAYRIKILNLVAFLKKSALPSSLRAGGFRKTVKVPLLVLGTGAVLSGRLLAF